ncbi:MAG: class I SAM-dependent methyltransferase [Lysobacterales bacterium]
MRIAASLRNRRAAILAGSIAFATAGIGGVLAAQSPALDVPTPYLPSTQLDVEEMLRVAAIGPQDVVVDLGSGDGRIVIAAAKYFGARGFGVDIDDKLVAEANGNAREAGVADRVQFYHRDIFATDIREATVVTLYLLSSLVNRLQPKLLAELKPGTRVVAHDYGFDNWKPDRTVKLGKTFYLYVVPAPVAGKWRLEAAFPDGDRDYEFELTQNLQEIRGGARVPGGYLPLFEPRLTGERISFVIADRQRSYRFDGRVTGNLMEGTVASGIGSSEVRRNWRATRILGAGLGEG